MPEKVPSVTYKVKPEDAIEEEMGCGTFYIIINEKEDEPGKPYRVFLKHGHTGLCMQALLEAIGRLLTIIFQSTDVPLERVIETLTGINCEAGMIYRWSCLDVFAKLLAKRYLPKKEEETDDARD